MSIWHEAYFGDDDTLIQLLPSARDKNDLNFGFAAYCVRAYFPYKALPYFLSNELTDITEGLFISGTENGELFKEIVHFCRTQFPEKCIPIFNSAASKLTNHYRHRQYDYDNTYCQSLKILIDHGATWFYFNNKPALMIADLLDIGVDPKKIKNFHCEKLVNRRNSFVKELRRVLYNKINVDDIVTYNIIPYVSYRDFVGKKRYVG
jgi:hypothetical protein